MREILSPMNNPRYVIVKTMYRFLQYSASFSCPSLLANNKENAAMLQEELRRQLGGVSVIYTRNEEGHRIYRKCVKRSFINYEENEALCIVRKMVY